MDTGRKNTNREDSTANASRDYPLINRGKQRDEYQRWVHTIYHDMVYYIVTTHPGLNILQITDEVSEVRKEWLSRVGDKVPKENWALPRGKPTRKTVVEGTHQSWSELDSFAIQT
jgi:hypothetical protein